MSTAPSDLRRLLPEPDVGAAPCKVCGAAAHAFGEVSFDRATGRPEPAPGGDAPRIRHHRCSACGLLFTTAFDHWSPADFQAHIYNSDYVTFDPDYVSARPTSIADVLGRLFKPARERVRLLDYGGGSGVLAELLRRQGFTCETYEPFSAAFSARPAGRFNLISCIETIEHLAHPMQTIADLARFADDQTLIFFTTLLQPADILEQGLGWWYVGPRNGHLTFHTPRSLAILWGRLGFEYHSLSNGMHFATRNPPDFADPLLQAVRARRG